MKSRTYNRGFAALLWAAAALAGCGNDNPQPPTTSSGVFTGGSENSGGGGAAGSNSGGSNAGGSNTGGAAGSSSGGSAGSENCAGPNDCYACPPKVDEQFLNACTAAQCAPFDNVTRLPLYNNGNLPPLP